MHALGLVTLLIGFRLAFKTDNVLLVIGSLVLGGITGEILGIEEGLEKLGEFIKSKVKSESGTFVLGFVTSSLVFCVGPMTVVALLRMVSPEMPVYFMPSRFWTDLPPLPLPPV